jgi:hypothetical protein
LLDCAESAESVSSGTRKTVAVQPGADGTPEVTESAIVELGVLLETTTTFAQVLLRDVLGA